MGTISNIKTSNSSEWDELKNKSIDESLKVIYDWINLKSREMCDWYWQSIKEKKISSLLSRSIAVFFLIVGTIFPLLAAVMDPAKLKLLFTQLGVAMLVIAGLLTLADRIFGWSSGWMRYIQTVTSMENLVGVYKIEWANYIALKTTPLEMADLIVLFNLTIALHNELLKLLSEETNKWIIEFNASISLLEATIKAQRDEAEKKLDVIRTNLSESNKEELAKKNAEEKTKKNGSIQVFFSFKDNKPEALKLNLDDSGTFDFLGLSWAMLDVKPGTHILNINTTTNPIVVRKIIIDVKPSETAKETIVMSS
ncbi:SLATT domain-containing protein [Algoriphagus sp. AGSA1]|uniref:SLATT domain-containing protein n=1 Tax=Algoriphagus sp. AGSA1 TaxID=2907213 RepID=UPI001F26957A|nr:SLATT domain-containing protein [Algoriphagus sp. AGSA1]